MEDKIKDYNSYKLNYHLYKFIKTELSLVKGCSSKDNALEAQIFGKLVWLINNKNNFRFPSFKNKTPISFQKNNSLISFESFRMIYVFKTLDISMNVNIIEELMFKTKKINPTLSNEECLSIASVILRVQNTISANAKRKLKIAN